VTTRDGDIGNSGTASSLPDRHLLTLEVVGRPRVVLLGGGGSVEGGDPGRGDANEVWDLDNLIKPTLDALEGVFGLRPWAGQP
jgi:hypothetical protein